MKRSKDFLVLLLLAAPVISQAKTIKVEVNGMVCSFCVQGIEKKFKSLPEIADIKVSLETKKVELNTKGSSDLPDDQIKKIVSDSGYEVVRIVRAN